jgi:hypothetical protein
MFFTGLTFLSSCFVSQFSQILKSFFHFVIFSIVLLFCFCFYFFQENFLYLIFIYFFIFYANVQILSLMIFNKIQKRRPVFSSIYILRFLLVAMQVYLQPIAYMVEMKEQLEVSDLKGNKIGVMNVSYYLRKCYI